MKHVAMVGDKQRLDSDQSGQVRVRVQPQDSGQLEHPVGAVASASVEVVQEPVLPIDPLHFLGGKRGGPRDEALHRVAHRRKFEVNNSTAHPAAEGELLFEPGAESMQSKIVSWTEFRHRLTHGLARLP